MHAQDDPGSEPTADAPTADAPTADAPTADEPTADEPGADDSTTAEESAPDESTTPGSEAEAAPDTDAPPADDTSDGETAEDTQPPSEGTLEPAPPMADAPASGDASSGESPAPGTEVDAEPTPGSDVSATPGAAQPGDAPIDTAAAEPDAAADVTAGAEPTAEEPTADAKAAQKEEAAGGGGGAAAEQTPTEALFAEKCASCHSVGKGDRIGPDLKDVHIRRDRDWLHNFIQTPSSMLNTDPTAKALMKEYNGTKMPDLGLSDEEVDALIDLIEECSTGRKCNLEAQFTPATEATAEDIELGRKLFIGEVAFANGGPPCISCHNVNGASDLVGGGLLAKDLTQVFSRLGDEGLDASLRNPQFPVMNRIFVEEKKLTPEEVFAVRAYLYDVHLQAPEASENYTVPLLAAVGTLLVIIILNVFWSRRLRGVRRTIAPTNQEGQL